MGTYRHYDVEFKKKIVEIVDKKEKTITEIAEEYALAKNTVANWVKRYKNTSSFRAEDQLTSEQKELRRLQKEIKILKEENEILKKATAIFSQSQIIK